jgi:uncharacterized protein YlzI (FlbEa/FlbD family)
MGQRRAQVLLGLVVFSAGCASSVRVALVASAMITLSSGETIVVSGSVHEVMAQLSRGRWVEFVNADGVKVAVNPFLAQSVTAIPDDGDFIRPPGR